MPTSSTKFDLAKPNVVRAQKGKSPREPKREDASSLFAFTSLRSFAEELSVGYMVPVLAVIFDSSDRLTVIVEDMVGEEVLSYYTFESGDSPLQWAIFDKIE